MKILLTLFVLFFSFSVVADDISDYEIDGISIGDSLLDYFSEKEIKLMLKTKTVYPKSDKFIKIETERLILKDYDAYSFHIKNNDSKYIIFALDGGKYFGKNNVKKCIEFKDKVVKDLTSTFKSFEPYNYDYIYKDVDDGKSIAYITDFMFEKGSVRTWCVDWSEVTEKKRNFVDNVTVAISSRELLDWLNSEAYN